jgi:ABC-type multidrug transport system ATPase subunit
MAGSAIEVSGLTRRFGSVLALDRVDFAVSPGTVFGLLGPNGAGKTTAIRVLTTLLRPDAGTARVLGLDVVRDAAAVRQQIGLAGQYAAVDEHLTGRENLRLMGRLAQLPRSQFRPVPTRCWTASAWPGRPPGRCGPTRAGCAGGWMSPPRWSPARRCCFSTSRPRDWT